MARKKVEIDSPAEETTVEQKPVTTTPDNLHAAILRVMAKVPYVYKAGRTGNRGDSFSFSYAGESHLLEKLHPALVESGLIFVLTKTDIVSEETYPNKNSVPTHRVKVKCTYSLIHVSTGGKIEVESVGEGCDQGDKATPKALTIARKYAFRCAFSIETGDDPDRNSSEEHLIGNQSEPVPAPAVAPAPTSSSQPVRTNGTASHSERPSGTELTPEQLFEVGKKQERGENFVNAVNKVASAATETDFVLVEKYLVHSPARAWNFSTEQVKYLTWLIKKARQEKKLPVQ